MKKVDTYKGICSVMTEVHHVQLWMVSGSLPGYRDRLPLCDLFGKGYLGNLMSEDGKGCQSGIFQSKTNTGI